MNTLKKILPFRATFYNQDSVQSLRDLVTPPYDVISSKMQQEFYERSPHNFCRIDLTQESAPQRYEVAKATYQNWCRQNILIQDDKPAIYLHHHSFILPDGQKVTRQGFFAVRRLEDFSEGGIKPHEKTLDAPKQDRLALTRALESQLSPVFSLYRDPQNAIRTATAKLTATTPFVDFVSADEERHQVWKMRDPDLINMVENTLSASPLFIADGHHRYETALNYRNLVLAQHPDLPENAAARYVLMYFSSMNDTGLVILPIHRALRQLHDFSAPVLLEKLRADFELTHLDARDVGPIEDVLDKAPKNAHHFFLLTKDPAFSHLLSLSKEKWQNHPLALQIPEALRHLDVTILHKLVFEHCLGMSEEDQAQQKNLVYWKSTAKAIDETLNGDCDATFLLNPTRIGQMETVAMAGLKMPQKSTYFYPKIISGLVLHNVSPMDVDGA